MPYQHASTAFACCTWYLCTHFACPIPANQAIANSWLELKVCVAKQVCAVNDNVHALEVDDIAGGVYAIEVEPRQLRSGFQDRLIVGHAR